MWPLKDRRPRQVGKLARGRAATERGVQSVQSAAAVLLVGGNAIRIGFLLTGRRCVTLDAFISQADRETDGRREVIYEGDVQRSARWTTILPAGRAQCNSATGRQRSVVQCSGVQRSAAHLSELQPSSSPAALRLRGALPVGRCTRRFFSCSLLCAARELHVRGPPSPLPGCDQQPLTRDIVQ